MTGNPFSRISADATECLLFSILVLAIYYNLHLLFNMYTANASANDEEFSLSLFDDRSARIVYSRQLLLSLTDGVQNDTIRKIPSRTNYDKTTRTTI